MQPLITIGIPTYNRPEGLRSTLKSITAQSYENIEIIVSDNCSSDKMVSQVIEDFKRNDKRIISYKQDNNIGAFNNFKFVLEKASGSFFMWAADDDERTLDFIEELVAAIGNHSAVFCNYAVKYEKSGCIEHIKMQSYGGGIGRYDQASIFLQKRIPSMIYGLYRIDDIRWFIKTERIFDWFDCYLILKIILLFDGFAFCDKELYTAGVHGDNYEYKPMLPNEKRIFTYTPYFVHSYKVIFQAKVSFSQKLKLLKCLTDVNFRSFLLTEKVRKNYWFYSFLFKIYSRLVPTSTSNQQ